MPSIRILASISFIDCYAKIHPYEFVPRVLEKLKFVMELMLEVDAKVFFSSFFQTQRIYLIKQC